jgi:hypothetical protein
MKKMTLQKIKERPWERKGGEVQWDPLDDDQKENNREEMSNQVPIVNVILINDKFLSNAVLVMRTHHLRDWCLQKNHSADNERAREEDKKGTIEFCVCSEAHYLMSLKNYKTGPRRLSYKCLFSLLFYSSDLLSYLISLDFFESLLELKNQNNFFVNQNALMINGWTLISCRLRKFNFLFLLCFTALMSRIVWGCLINKEPTIGGDERHRIYGKDNFDLNFFN